MLEHLGLADAARDVEQAVISCLEAKECTADVGGGLTTGQAGDAVARRLAR
jgi:isocitrate/isopropylmalate dehydrogenase